MKYTIGYFRRFCALHEPVVRAPCCEQIFPTSGPIEGGTSLTISGENLGIHVDETAAAAVDVQCHVSHYVTPSAKSVTLLFTAHQRT